MKKFLNVLLPKNKKDVYFWLLFAVALLPIVYISLFQLFSYMELNTVLLCVIVWCVLFRFIKNLVYKRKINFPKNPAFIIITAMFLWMFISSFFSQNPMATWFRVENGYRVEVSIFQYLFYYMVAVCAMNMDKKNIKHLFYTILFVINTIIIVEFFMHDYGFGFIHPNHAGYYMITSVSLTIGMILYCKNKYELIPLGISLFLHFISFVLNHSLGPIIGLIALFIISFVYYLIYNRKMLIRLSGIILSCIAIFSFFDFVPKVKDYRIESTPVIIQVRDLGLSVLNKTGIISDEKVSEIASNSGYNNGELAPGSDGWNRLMMWKVCLNNMKEFPLFGVGVGAWNSYNKGMPNRAPHNEFLEYGALAGIPCLLLYLALLIYLFVKFRKNRKTQEDFSFIVFAAIGAYIVQSIFGNIMPFTAPVFYMMIGFAMKFVDEKKEEINNNEESDLSDSKKEESILELVSAEAKRED